MSRGDFEPMEPGAVQAYFDQRGWRYTTSSASDWIRLITCPACGDGSRQRLAINKHTGAGKCWHCGWTGGLHLLRKEAGELPAGHLPRMSKMTRPKRKPQAAPTKPQPSFADIERLHQNLLSNAEQVEKLRVERKLDLAIIQEAKLGWSNSQGLAIPYFENGRCVRMKFKPVNPSPNKFTSLTGGKTTLYGLETLTTTSKRAYLTEGEQDALVLRQAGLPNVLSLPNGIGNRWEDCPWLDPLEQFEEVVLLADADDAGRDGLWGDGSPSQKATDRQGLVDTIGRDRACVVDFPAGAKDPTDVALLGDIIFAEFLTACRNASPLGSPAIRALVDYLHPEDVYSDDWPARIGIDEIEHLTGRWRGGEMTVLTGWPKSGKCQSFDTPVLRYDGMIVMVQDVQVGDLLMGPDSQPRRVLSTTRGSGPMYRIIPNKGESWGCNGPHVLTLVDRRGEIQDLALDDYLRGVPGKAKLKLFQPDMIEFPRLAGVLTVSPYFLGIWLGDGSKSLDNNGVSITKPDAEIERACRDEASQFGATVSIYCTDRCPTYRIVTERGKPNDLLTAMRGLMANGIRIPRRYLVGSIDERLEVLAGLLDTDGHLASDGQYFEITQKRRELAEDIAFLARSLGFRVTMRVKHVDRVPYYRMNILGEIWRIPTRIVRKQASPKNKEWSRNALRTGFRVESVGNDDYYGFELDGDGRFLLGDFTVTHNSTLGMNFAAMQAAQGVPALIITLENPVAKYAICVAERIITKPWKRAIEGIVMNPLERQQAEEMMRRVPLWALDAHGEQDVEFLLQTINYARRRYGVRFIVLDHFHRAIRVGRGHDPIQTLDDAVTKLHDLCISLADIHLLMIAHLRKPGNFMTAPRYGRDRDKEPDDARNPRPTKFDLKGAQALLGVPDNIWILWRREHQNVRPGRWGDSELIIDGTRSNEGANGKIDLTYYRPGQAFCFKEEIPDVLHLMTESGLIHGQLELPTNPLDNTADQEYENTARVGSDSDDYEREYESDLGGGITGSAVEDY